MNHDSSAALILLVEDDPGLQQVLTIMLESEGHRVTVAGTLEIGGQLARQSLPDLAIVDLGLPDGEGAEFVRNLREWTPVPIIVLSARTAEAQRLMAFEAGADDFVLKPFSGPELKARIRASLRRRAQASPHTDRVRIGNLSIDRLRRVIKQGQGTEVRLTPLEQRLLEALSSHANRLLTHAQLIREVWGAGCADARSLRVLLASLRRKLESDGGRQARIERQVGVGYRLVIEASEGTSVP